MITENKRYLKLLLGLVTLFVCIGVKAQNNPYKLNDEVYNYFVYVDNRITLDGTLQRCDTLYRLAHSKGDLKGECLAYYERTAYYCAKQDSANLLRAVDEAKAFCASTPYAQYYFGSWDNLINYYISRKEYEAALLQLNAYQQEAIRRNDQHGIAYSKILTGNIYYYSRHYRFALYKYKQALKYCKDTHYRGIAFLYEYISFAYYQLQEFDKAIECVQEAMDDPQSSDNYKTLSHHMALLYSCSKEQFNRQEATYWYQLAAKDVYTLEDQIEDVLFFQSIRDLYQARLNGTPWKNIYAVPDMTLPIYRVRNLLSAGDAKLSNLLKICQYESSNEYEAGHIILQYRTDKRQREQQAQRKDSIEKAKTTLALADAHLRQNQLLMLMQQQELELARKHLRNKQMEQDRKEQAAKTRKLKNKQELEAQQSTLREREEALQLRKQRVQIVFTAIFIFILIVCSIFVIVYTRARLKHLREENAKAHEADREKTLFYRTMSTEIRTPLNAILGFNEILNSEVANDLSDAEKKKIAGYIRANSELLTTLVNDVLDISKLESGTYKLYYSDFTLHSLIDAVTLTSGTDSEHHRIVVSIPDDEALYSDHQRLQQLLSILTAYAVRNSRGDIRLEYQRTADARIFRIRYAGKDEHTRRTTDEILKSHEQSQRDTLLDNNGNIRIAVLIARLFKGTLYTESTEQPNECVLCFKIPLKSICHPKKEEACA
jgi:signal transduction histidine kinase